MRKHGKVCLLLCVLTLLCGCGHSVLVESEVTGFAVRVPILEAGNLGVTLGSAKLTTATIRGGTTLETTSSSGGGIFSGDGGVNRITTFKTNAQLNEGNLKEVMLSTNVPDAAKIMLASNLCSAAKAPKVAQTVLQTPTTTIHTGEATISNSVEALNRVSGLDKVVETIPEVVKPVVNVIPETVHPVTDTVTNITTGLVDSVIGGVTEITGQVNETVTETSNDLSKIFKDLKWATLFKWIGLIIAAALSGWLVYIKVSKKGGCSSVRPAPVFQPVDPDNIEDTPVEPESPVESQDELPLEFPKPAKENTPSPKPKKEEEPTKKDEQPSEPKTPWYKKVITFFSVLWALFMRIPPEQRKRGFEFVKTLVKDWIAKKRAEKQAKQPE